MTKTAKLLSDYEDKWVAINKKGDKVLASAKDVKTLSNKLDDKKIGRTEAIMTFVPPFKGWYSPFNA